MDEMFETRQKAAQIKRQLELATFPVGVKFYFEEAEFPASVKRLTHHRYCQALMLARHGEQVILDAEGIACPAAAAAFGFKTLPEGLKTGKGLVGYGIVPQPQSGKQMFEGMTTLELGALKGLFLFPLEKSTLAPDIVVVEDEVEKLMWFALAEVNRTGGRRVESSTAILQATCVDATLLPYLKHRFNMSFGCYGCREATDIGTNETVLGFPFGHFEELASAIDFLAMKALANSRGKSVLAALKNSEGM